MNCRPFPRCVTCCATSTTPTRGNRATGGIIPASFPSFPGFPVLLTRLLAPEPPFGRWAMRDGGELDRSGQPDGYGMRAKVRKDSQGFVSIMKRVKVEEMLLTAII